MVVQAYGICLHLQHCPTIHNLNGQFVEVLSINCLLSPFALHFPPLLSSEHCIHPAKFPHIIGTFSFIYRHMPQQPYSIGGQLCIFVCFCQTTVKLLFLMQHCILFLIKVSVFVTALSCVERQNFGCLLKKYHFVFFVVAKVV